jgi:hypothetical protein
MVMEKGNLLWAVPASDITDDVIRNYDATGAKAGTLGAPPGEAAAHGASEFGSGSQPRSSAPAPEPPPSGAEAPADIGRSTISK